MYGPDASNGDITKRHIEPLVKKALEGYNTCVYTFGATGVLERVVCIHIRCVGVGSMGRAGS